MASNKVSPPEWVKTCAQDKNILDLEPFTSNDDPTKIFRIRSLAKNGNVYKDECFRFESLYGEIKDSVVTGLPPINPLTRKPLSDSDIAAFNKMRAEKFPALPKLDYPADDNAVNMIHAEEAITNMTNRNISPENYKKEVARIEKILSRRIVDAHTTNQNHQTLLILSVIQDNLPMVEKFVPISDVNQSDLNYATALHYACRRGNSVFINLLLKAGAKTEIKNKSGVFPIFETISYSYKPNQFESLKTMIAGGARPDVADDDGRTLLMTAAKFGDEYIDMLKYLIALPEVEIDTKDISGNTALMYGAESGNINAVKYLLSKGAGNYLNTQNKSAYDLCLLKSKKYTIATTLAGPTIPKRFQETLDVLKDLPISDESTPPVNLKLVSAAVEANKQALLEARIKMFMSALHLQRPTAEKYAKAYVAVLAERNRLEDAAEKSGKPLDPTTLPAFPPQPKSDISSKNKAAVPRPGRPAATPPQRPGTFKLAGLPKKNQKKPAAARPFRGGNYTRRR